MCEQWRKITTKSQLRGNQAYTIKLFSFEYLNMEIAFATNISCQQYATLVDILFNLRHILMMHTIRHDTITNYFYFMELIVVILNAIEWIILPEGTNTDV